MVSHQIWKTREGGNGGKKGYKRPHSFMMALSTKCKERSRSNAVQYSGISVSHPQTPSRNLL